MTETAVLPEPVLAMVAGSPYLEVPADLFIPPDALLVLLDSFSGPLDLLLYLIRKQNIDILNIPIAIITKQYMNYIHLMEAAKLELAADYLVMAAILAEIKSRMLLPPKPSDDPLFEEDPRMQLVRRLQAYEIFKKAADWIENLPRVERDIFPVTVATEPILSYQPQVPVELNALVIAMRALLREQSHLTQHHITREPLSVRQRVLDILARIEQSSAFSFNELYSKIEGRMGLIVSFLAVLELSKQFLLVMIQTENFSPIYIRATTDESK